MLAKNISGVAYSIDVIEVNDLGFTYTVKTQSHVTFVKLGSVGSNGTFHNSHVVSKHVAPATDLSMNCSTQV
jgi:hypothetical protein